MSFSSQSTVTTTTWAEEDAGQIVRVGNPDGYCPDPCLGVSVVHPAHLAPPAVEVLGTVSGGTVARSDGIVYFLTPCCQASATGTERGTACRACYQAIPEALGWAGLAETSDIDVLLAAALRRLWDATDDDASVAVSENVARRLLSA